MPLGSDPFALKYLYPILLVKSDLQTRLEMIVCTVSRAFPIRMRSVCPAAPPLWAGLHPHYFFSPISILLTAEKIARTDALVILELTPTP